AKFSFMEEWNIIKAYDYCYNVTDGTHDSPKQTEFGKYLITSKHIKDNRIDFESAYKISEDDYNKIITRSKVDQWDIIISMIGAYCGFCCIESSKQTDYAIKNVGLLKVGNELKCKWLYYYLTSPHGKQQLSKLRSGSSQPYISLGALRNLDIPVPNENTMSDIVSVLSSLDSKIELNRRINDNLEQQAQALFKAWFVDFEPFKDGEFVDDDFGRRPYGWNVKPLKYLVEKVKSGDWGKDEQMGNHTMRTFCMRGADFPDIKEGSKGKMPIRYILEKNFREKTLCDGNVVVEISGGSPTQSTGRIVLIDKTFIADCDNALICTNFCKSLEIKESFSLFFYFLWQYLYDKKVMFIYENGSNGLKNLNINSLLERELFVIPPKEIISRFNLVVSLLLSKKQANGIEISRLASLRDTLLPKLMSGNMSFDY
ncbi:MAG: restriction endonuclease subunit S, partial [Bacteroides caccae]|nr:restriction endonuclease subunit S [Bacteroides caccae]